jgi:DNA modification methylase
MLIRGDATVIPLADDSVDLVVTSPPYFALRSYQDGDEHYDGQIGSEASPQEFLEALWAATVEMVRVVKPSGSIFVNLGDKYAGSNAQQSGASQLQGGSYNPDGTRSKAPKKGGYIPRTSVRTKSLMGMPWRYAIGCIDDLGLILRSEIVWSKPNGLPESVTDRVRRSHEQWFHFTLEPRYFSAIDEIREHHKEPERSTGASVSMGATDYGKGDPGVNTAFTGQMPRAYNPLGKLPGSVWSIPSEPLQIPDQLGVDHFAAFPQEWPRRLILGWCPQEVCSECGQGRAPVVEKDYAGVVSTIPGGTSTEGRHRSTQGIDQDVATVATITGYACACPDNSAPSTPGVVLDPFVGTGTVPMVARALGRTGIGVDLSADYLRLADWRVFESGHAAKTMRRTNAERQGSLL